tara:strand:- start:123 stop:332 length:210 start_codon:yes stop_codon:yes gene_type:complete
MKTEIIKKFKEHKQLVPSIKLKPFIKTMKKKVHKKILSNSYFIRSSINSIHVKILISLLRKNNVEKNRN